MNIVVTGSLGNIGKPLTQALVQKGHAVTVISSKDERRSSIIVMDDAHVPNHNAMNAVFDFYFIALKRMKGMRYKYGQQLYDFQDDGALFFMSPKQVLNFGNIEEKNSENHQVGFYSSILILFGIPRLQKQLINTSFLNTP